jgi:hypothetical protein
MRFPSSMDYTLSFTHPASGSTTTSCLQQPRFKFLSTALQSLLEIIPAISYHYILN